MKKLSSMIDGTDHVLPLGSIPPYVALEVAVRTLRRVWPKAVADKDDAPGRVLSLEDLDYAGTRELFVYRDKAALASWSARGATDENRAFTVHFLVGVDDLTVVTDDGAGYLADMIAREVLGETHQPSVQNLLLQVASLREELAQKTEFLRRANESRRRFQARAHRAEGILASHKGEDSPIGLRDAISSLRTNLHHRDRAVRNLRLQLIDLTTPSGTGLPERWLVINEESAEVATRYKVFDELDSALECMSVYGVPETWVARVRELVLKQGDKIIGWALRFVAQLAHVQLVRVR